jgi:hypothetical protein
MVIAREYIMERKCALYLDAVGITLTYWRRGGSRLAPSPVTLQARRKAAPAPAARARKLVRKDGLSEIHGAVPTEIHVCVKHTHRWYNIASWSSLFYK